MEFAMPSKGTAVSDAADGLARGDREDLGAKQRFSG